MNASKIPRGGSIPQTLRQALEFGVCVAFGSKAAETMESIVRDYLAQKFSEVIERSTPTEVLRLWELWTLITGEKKP